MAGRRGRSGGHNKVPLEDHLIRGTFNATRHGKRAAAVQRAVVASTEPLPAALVEGLVGRGLTFVAEVWQGYHGWTPSSSLLLREVGLVIDQLEALRGQEGERAAQRVLLALLGALRLEDA